jgi:hypothetical protein
MKVSTINDMAKAIPACSRNPKGTTAREPRETASINPSDVTTFPDPDIAPNNPSSRVSK